LATQVNIVMIWNLALAMLNQRQINSVNELSRNAEILRNIWELVRVDFLADHFWVGAKRSVVLNKLDVESPTNRYTSVFHLPFDYLRMIRMVRQDARVFDPDERNPDVRYDIENSADHIDQWLLANGDQVEIQYVADIRNVGHLTPKAQKALAYQLAVDVAPSFGKDPADLKLLIAMNQRQLQDAKTVSSTESTPKRRADTDLVRSRWRPFGPDRTSR